ncbi:WD40-repeat-containing domain protein [Catenaria anguillulae PL171]|uniref:WD40-repeat-containing domain protein n=1 Tax=Catenaria anguillulae PL171 TaxID=765915 RepID=A0A1Y2HTR8_9FUNG|nr:WD40-repeat-containing domain protein [Catenaria anguillulae PL171]
MSNGPSSVTLGLAQVFASSEHPDLSSTAASVGNHGGDDAVSSSNTLGRRTVSGNMAASTAATNGHDSGNNLNPSHTTSSNPSLAASPTKSPRKASKVANDDIHQYMNIHHFEQLMTIFKTHRNEDGEEGFDIDTFREVFGSVLGGNLSFDQMTQLFMKIDANSDGTVSWDEFSTFVVMVSGLNQEYVKAVVDERVRKLVDSSHKDLIKRIDYIAKERKYFSISRDGTICLWSPKLKLQRSLTTREGMQAWVTDAVLMQDQNKLAVVSDDRQLTIFEMMSIKPRKLITIAPLENNPLSIAYASKFEDERSVLVFGDDGGFINILSFTRRFFVDYTSDNEPLVVKPSLLSHREDNPYRGTITLHRKKVHNEGEWVERIQCFREINAFVTCSSGSVKSLVISDLERKTTRSISVSKGVRCFDYCRRPSFIVTGGRDKVIRLWNPYVLSKAAGSLVGHNAVVTDVLVNQADGHIISLSEDKVIKIWNIRTMNCLQTLTDRFPHRPENVLSAIYFDNVHRQLITGSSKLESWPLYSQYQQSLVRSHEAPIVAALFNNSFHQIVSGCEDSTVTVWEAYSGEKTFQFNQVHGNLEITAMCFDGSGRRLITGSRDGTIKVWNFNNGQLLRKCIKNNSTEVSAVLFTEIGANKYILAVGWDRKISVFLDSPEPFECKPLREIHDAYRGHREDILCVTFAPPSLVATGGLDGSIVVWNLESGTWRCHLADPLLEYKSLESKAVEELGFLYDRTLDVYPKNFKFPLLSAHADGYLRIWDVYEATLVHEVSCGLPEGEGLTGMAMNQTGTRIVVSGSAGHIRVIEVKPFSVREKVDWSGIILVKDIWKCHAIGITCISFISSHNAFLTGAADTTVRLWLTDGNHIGTLGQGEPWDLDDPTSYMPVPADVRQENAIEKKREEFMVMHREELKSAVIGLWKTSKSGLLNSNQASFALQAISNPLFDLDDDIKKAWANYKAVEASLDPKETNARQQLKDMETQIVTMISERLMTPSQNSKDLKISQSNRVVALQMSVVRKWKEFTHRQKMSREWRLDDSDLTIRQSTAHFCYSHSKVHPASASRPTVRIGSVRPETVYKELVKHTKYELTDLKMPEKPNHSKDTSWFTTLASSGNGGSGASSGLPHAMSSEPGETTTSASGTAAVSAGGGGGWGAIKRNLIGK